MEKLEKLTYTVIETAKVTGLSPATIRRLLSQGQIKCSEIYPGSRKLLIRKQEIERWLDKNQLCGLDKPL